LWDQRAAQLRQLAQIRDPEAFAAAAADTKFGPIDVFVLTDHGSTWKWNDIAFSPASFGADRFTVRHLPHSTVVAVRTSPGP